MNERIKELWAQAGGHYNSGNQHTWPEYTIADPEKFAELIIKECMAIAQEYDGAKLGGPGLVIAMRIESHFGVENAMD